MMYIKSTVLIISLQSILSSCLAIAGEYDYYNIIVKRLG